MEAVYQGIGRRERRRMVQRWKQECQGKVPLKQWARDQNPVGDAAFLWVKAKGRKQP
jgi:hypothetical protein